MGKQASGQRSKNRDATSPLAPLRRQSGELSPSAALQRCERLSQSGVQGCNPCRGSGGIPQISKVEGREPGAAGGSVDDVKALLPVVVAEHIAWLQAHGESVATDADLSVVEEVDGRGEFVFAADKERVGNADIETAIRRAGDAQDDLIARVRPLPAPGP